jgi:hypothetical protein
MERLLLELATTQPLSFFEVLCSEAGERIRLRDILVGGETEVVERSASRMLQTGDIIYGQIWDLQRFSILGLPDPDPAKLERRSDQSSKEVAKES